MRFNPQPTSTRVLLVLRGASAHKELLMFLLPFSTSSPNGKWPGQIQTASRQQWGLATRGGVFYGCPKAERNALTASLSLLTKCCVSTYVLESSGFDDEIGGRVGLFSHW